MMLAWKRLIHRDDSKTLSNSLNKIIIRLYKLNTMTNVN